MDSTKNTVKTAQIVIISSTLTLFLLLGVAFIARDYIVVLLANQVFEIQKVDEQSNSVTTIEPIVEMVAKVSPAVVSIVITKDVPIYEQYYETFGPFGPYSGFTIPRVRENGTQEREVGGGSGFIVSNDGMIVTNNHVVSDIDARYSAVLDDGQSYVVEVLARDSKLDIAILKITEPPAQPLPFVLFGDSDSLQLGQTVIAIGNALAEFQNSVSVGVISGLSRSIVASDRAGRSEQLDQVIQTDAAINPGNSGGPLLNVEGEVIGVNVATSQGADNIGFALPASSVKQVVESVRQYGEIIRPYLGVRYMMVTPRLKDAKNLLIDYGALIETGTLDSEVAVLPDSPAAKAGLQSGDIILSIDGETLRERDLLIVLQSKTVGQSITLEVQRGTELKTIVVTLEKAL